MSGDMDTDAIWTSIALKPSEEQILSQKLTKLFTTTVSAKGQSTALKDVKDSIEKIPDYLTKRNKSFKEILYQALSTANTIAMSKSDHTHKIEELRKIAVVIYKIMIVQTYHRLWTTYLKSGMGQLNTSSQTKLSYSTIAASIWPKQIKTYLSQQLTNCNKPNDDHHQFYLKFIQDHLYELDQQLKQFQIELNLKTKDLQDYTLTIQKIIEVYIEQNLQSLRMKIEHKIELIHYDYHIRVLKLEFLQHQPNADHEKLMKHICRAKFAQETTEQEYHFLQKQIAYYNLRSQSFDSSSLSHSPLIDSIENAAVREVVLQQFKEIAEQSRAAVSSLYLQSATDHREEYTKKYEAAVKKMLSDHHSLDHTPRKMPPIMIQFINERCEKISERIKCIYKFKTASIN